MKTLLSNINDKRRLYQCYMPFIVGGGLFVETNEDVALGEEISLELTLFDARYSFNAVVVWLTPQDAVGRLRPQGVGVAIPEANQALAQEIETLLVALPADGLERFTF